MRGRAIASFFWQWAGLTCRPCDDFGGSQGFHRLVAAIKSAAPSFWMRSRMANGVEAEKKVAPTPFRRPSAS